MKLSSISSLMCLATLAATASCVAQDAPQPPPLLLCLLPVHPPKMKVHVMHAQQTPFLGVHIQELTPDRVTSLKLKDNRGVEVVLVDKDAAAGKAGLRPHDVIVTFNGAPIEGSEQFRRMIRETPVGHGAQLGIVRDSQTITVPVTMGGMIICPIPLRSRADLW